MGTALDCVLTLARQYQVGSDTADRIRLNTLASSDRYTKMRGDQHAYRLARCECTHQDIGPISTDVHVMERDRVRIDMDSSKFRLSWRECAYWRDLPCSDKAIRRARTATIDRSFFPSLEKLGQNQLIWGKSTKEIFAQRNESISSISGESTIQLGEKPVTYDTLVSC